MEPAALAELAELDPHPWSDPAAGAGLWRRLAARCLTDSVAGERRWRAAQMAGLAVLPAIVKEVSAAGHARAGPGRERPARRPQPAGGGCGLPGAGRRVRADPGGGGGSRRQEPCGGDQLNASAASAHDGQRSCHRRADQRGPRPRAARPARRRADRTGAGRRDRRRAHRAANRRAGATPGPPGRRAAARSRSSKKR